MIVRTAAEISPVPFVERRTPSPIASVFPIVVLGRQQLFTENTLTPLLAWLHNRDVKTLVDVLRLWSLVLIANIAGTAAIATVPVHAPIFDPQVHIAFAHLSERVLAGTFGETTLRPFLPDG